MSGDVESPEGAEEVEMATSGATLTMLDKAVLGGVRWNTNTNTITKTMIGKAVLGGVSMKHNRSWWRKYCVGEVHFVQQFDGRENFKPNRLEFVLVLVWLWW